MRYAVFSDIHSNLQALEAVIAAYKEESIDRYICVGDIIGYAADPGFCIDEVSSRVEICVAGNHDQAALDLFPLRYFNPIAKEALLWTRRQLEDKHRLYLESLNLVYKNQDLTLVHGTLQRPQEFDYLFDEYSASESFRLLETRVGFIGHTHVAGIFIKDKKERIIYRQDESIELEENHHYLVNVGSVGQPRDGDPRAAYCIYDTEKNKIHLKRVGYDIASARNKIIQNRLPKFLGDRLIQAR